jgi:hypothetical protein
MRGFVILTTLVLAVIGVGIGILGASPPTASADCFAVVATDTGRTAPVPTPERVTASVSLPGGYKVSPAPASFVPRSSAAAAWKADGWSTEAGETYAVYLGRRRAAVGQHTAAGLYV